MPFRDALLLAFIIMCILLYILFTTKTEGFDTYYNHDIGAYDVYNENTSPKWQTGFKPSNIEQANRYANYTWSERDPRGMTVYDQYYENYTLDMGGANDNDREYAYRDIGAAGEDNVYDEKFSNRDGYNLFFTYSPRYIADMVDKHPATAYDFHSDELAVIAQKNY
jgi:hypothetical protein